MIRFCTVLCQKQTLIKSKIPSFRKCIIVVLSKSINKESNNVLKSKKIEHCLQEMSFIIFNRELHH